MGEESGLLGKVREWAFGARTGEAANVAQVILAERDEIEQSRIRRGEHPLSHTPLKGLAFSGGGIRSATFCLGVAQALARAGLLKRFDYLSTVSGGGYIGGWLTAWIKRSPRGVIEVEEKLSESTVGGKEAPIEFLRDYSNYLAPNTGFFSADTWTIASVWMRNTALNQAVIFLFLGACLMAPRILALMMPWIARFPLAESFPAADYTPAIPGAIAVVLLIIGCRRIAKNLLWFERSSDFIDTRALRDGQKQAIYVGLMMLVACWLGAAAMWHGEEAWYTPIIVGVVFMAGVIWLGILSGFRRCFVRTVGQSRGKLWLLALLMTAVGSGLTGGVLTLGVGKLFTHWADGGPGATWHLAVWGAPVLLLQMTIVAMVQIGLMGRWMPDDRREWWSRLGAWMGILITACIVVGCVSVYGPLLVARGFEAFPKIAKGITATWLLTTISGVLAGKSGKTGGEPATGKSMSDSMLEWITQIAPYVAIGGVILALSTLLNLVFAAVLCAGAKSEPYPPHATSLQAGTVVLKGTIGAGDMNVRLSVPVDGSIEHREVNVPFMGSNVACACRYRNGFFPGWRFLDEQHWALLGPLYKAVPAWGGPGRYMAIAWLGIIVLAASTFFLAWRIDVNEFSLHHFYKNRLVRCYLGATNPKRDQSVNPFTGFSNDDDVPVAALSIDAPLGAGEHTYIGPYLIVNGALNFTHGKRLAWQERKAASFIFSPKFSGYDGVLLKATRQEELGYNAYRPTDTYAYPEEGRIGGVHLGTAMAISGAAASPNMGYHSSAPLAFLLTLFNVRLGWWLGNPRHERKWKRSGPAIGLLYLLDELFGSADADSDYVYISDGGHFENLALYELVRRKCRFIVACDAEEDHEFKFGGLGNAVRKCRDDLGVDIDVDLRPLLDRDEDGRTKTHGVLGSIDYHDGKKNGVLVYLKSSLTQPDLHREPVDVLEYSMRAPEFPHQTTADQFFDESQFESYRRLGMHIGGMAARELQKADLV